MKNYFYFAVLCCLLSSCDKKTNEIVKDKTKGVFTKNNYYLPWDALKSKPSGELVNQIPDWFEEEYPAYEVASWFTMPPTYEAGGIYISYVKKDDPDDTDIFIVDESGSLVTKIKSLKAEQKPTLGGGTFYNTNDVWIRYHLENGYFIPEILDNAEKVFDSDPNQIETKEDTTVSAFLSKNGRGFLQKTSSLRIGNEFLIVKTVTKL